MEMKVFHISVATVLFAAYYVSTCPVDNVTWTNRSTYFNCSPWSYHCGFTERGKLEEFCMIPRILSPKKCPVFDLNSPYGYRSWNCTHKIPIITKECSEQNLPQTYYRTDQLYKYPVCFLGQELVLVSRRIKPSSRTDSTPDSTSPLSSISTSVNMKIDQISIVQWTDNDDSSTPILNDISIEMKSYIVAFFAIDLTVNLAVFLFTIRRTRQKLKTQNAGRISEAEVVDEEDMYEYINDTALQPPLTEQNENLNVHDNDDMVNIYKPREVTVMQGANNDDLDSD